MKKNTSILAPRRKKRTFLGWLFGFPFRHPVFSSLIALAYFIMLKCTFGDFGNIAGLTGEFFGTSQKKTFDLAEWQKWHRHNNRFTGQGKRIVSDLKAFKNELKSATDPHYLKITVDAGKYLFAENTRELEEMCAFQCLSGDCDDFAFMISHNTFRGHAPVYIFDMPDLDYGNHAVCCGNMHNNRYIFSWYTDFAKSRGITDGLAVYAVEKSESDEEAIIRVFSLAKNAKVYRVRGQIKNGQEIN